MCVFGQRNEILPRRSKLSFIEENNTPFFLTLVISLLNFLTYSSNIPTNTFLDHPPPLSHLPHRTVFRKFHLPDFLRENHGSVRFRHFFFDTRVLRMLVVFTRFKLRHSNPDSLSLSHTHNITHIPLRKHYLVSSRSLVMYV